MVFKKFLSPHEYELTLEINIYRTRHYEKKITTGPLRLNVALSNGIIGWTVRVKVALKEI